MEKKTIPSNYFSETIVLSACMCSIDALNEAVDRLQPASFYHSKNSLVFEACKRMYLENRTVDTYSVIAELKDTIDAKEAGELLALRDYHDSDVELSSHIDVLIKCWQHRSLYFSTIKMGEEILEGSAEPDTIVEKYVCSHTNIIAGNIKGIREFKEIMDDFDKGTSFEDHLIEKQQRAAQGLSPYQGIRSHYPMLDQALGAFQNGCLHYIGARTSMGKTTFLLNIVKNILRNEPDSPLAFLSLEMRAPVIVAKMLCMMAHVTYSAYTSAKLSAEEYHRLVECGRILKGKLFIDDEAMDISRLAARARRLVHVNDVKILFIDYLTCIRANEKFNSNHERINQVSKGLLALSKELNIPIVCLAQLNRSLTARVDKSPTLADFRESGSIEEDCDVAMLIHRPLYYDPLSTDPFTHLIIAKNRLMGDLRRIKYTWDDERPGVYTEEQPLDSVRPFQPKEKKNGSHDANNW